MKRRRIETRTSVTILTRRRPPVWAAARYNAIPERQGGAGREGMPYSRGRSNPGQGAGTPRYPGTFVLALRAAAEGLGWQVRRWHGGAVVFVDGESQERTVGLDNLYREARRVPREEWPSLIAEFLGAALAAEGEAELPKDLASVADRLLVRVGKPLTGLPEGLRTWSQPIADTDLVLNLVIDSPRSMSYVTEEVVADSGQPASVWVERALA